MFFIIEKTSGDLKIADAFSLKQYAYNTMVENAFSYIRSEVGDRKAQNAQVSDINDIAEDGYYLVVAEGNLEATIYHRETQGGWIQNGYTIKPVLQYFIRECVVRQEKPVVVNQQEIDVSPQKKVPTTDSRQYVHLLDELRAKLVEIREQVRLDVS